MPLVPIRIQPGVNTQATKLLNSSGWSESENIRFFQGLPQKAGGYVSFTHTLPGAGVPKALRPWTALSGASYLGIACDRRLDLFAAEVVYDITPLTISALVPISLTTTAGSTTVVIHDAIDPAPAVGECIQIHDPVSIANIVLQGAYLITAIGSNQYSIVVPVAANASVTGGSCREFTTIIGQSTVTVTLPNHGLFTGETVMIPDPTPVGGIVLQGGYTATVTGQNTYTISQTTLATSSSTVIENGNSIQITFTNPPSGGVQGDFRNNTATLANWGELLFWCPQGGPVYQWQPSLGLGPGNIATDITTAPQSNGVIFVATQQQMLFCCGTINPMTGLFDPMLVAWSDAGDYTDFIPTVTNQAGSFRLVTGSRIVGALPLAGGNLIWTDIALYVAQYLTPPLVWGFQPTGINCGLTSAHGFGTIGQNVMWESQNQFYYLAGGSPQVLQCSVWDLIFKNIDPTQVANIVCETNSFFNEASWEVPQQDGTVTRARVQIDTGLWDYTMLPSGNFLPRTAWTDQSVFGPPLGADATGAVYQHEVSTDAAGEPLRWRLATGEIMLSEGDDITFFREMLPDFKFSETGSFGPGVVELVVFVYSDPAQPPRVRGPYPITSTTRSVPVRGRGRSISYELRGLDLGSWVRVGDPRVRVQPDGRY